MKEFHLSNLSLRRLEGVDPGLARLVKKAIKRTPVDFGVAWLGGLRTAQQQHSSYVKGYSKKDGYKKKSKHQSGLAVDFLPYVNGRPDTDTRENYLIIIGVLFAVAAEMGINIRSGANWDRDQEFLTDQDFDDLPHIELVEP
jgi:peptidoglycan L-alanyl-D-glutamate endopeptidase CwlK